MPERDSTDAANAAMMGTVQWCEACRGAAASIVTHDGTRAVPLCTACYAKRAEPDAPAIIEGEPHGESDLARVARIDREGLTIGNCTPCPKCGRPIGKVGDTMCPPCFAVLVNAAGKPVDGGTKPLRLTASEIVDKDQLEHRGTLLPVIAHDAMIHASERLAESLANDPEGAAMLYAQAKEHGLLVMVVVQPAIPHDQQKPATVAPRRR